MISGVLPLILTQAITLHESRPSRFATYRESLRSAGAANLLRARLPEFAATE